MNAPKSVLQAKIFTVVPHTWYYVSTRAGATNEGYIINVWFYFNIVFYEFGYLIGYWLQIFLQMLSIYIFVVNLCILSCSATKL